MANSIFEHIPPEQVALDLDLKTRKRAFEEAARMIEVNSGLPQKAVFDAFTAREKIGSTCIGGSCAIPHGRIQGLKAPVIVVLRTNDSIDYDVFERRRVRLLFAVAVPERQDEACARTLSELTEMLKAKEMREAFMRAPDAYALLEAVERWEPPVITEDDFADDEAAGS